MLRERESGAKDAREITGRESDSNALKVRERERRRLGLSAERKWAEYRESASAEHWALNVEFDLSRAHVKTKTKRQSTATATRKQKKHRKNGENAHGAGKIKDNYETETIYDPKSEKNISFVLRSPNGICCAILFCTVTRTPCICVSFFFFGWVCCVRGLTLWFPPPLHLFALRLAGFFFLNQEESRAKANLFHANSTATWQLIRKTHKNREETEEEEAGEAGEEEEEAGVGNSRSKQTQTNTIHTDTHSLARTHSHTPTRAPCCDNNQKYIIKNKQQQSRAYKEQGGKEKARQRTVFCVSLLNKYLQKQNINRKKKTTRNKQAWQSIGIRKCILTRKLSPSVTELLSRAFPQSKRDGASD